MEDFSGFIHEEIFLIDSPESQPTQTENPPAAPNDPLPTYELGVVALNASSEDKGLLEKILGAISIGLNEVVFSDEITSQSSTWIVFSDTLNFSQKDLQHFSITNVNGQLIIPSKSLETLRNSVEDKGKLWGILKEHFKR